MGIINGVIKGVKSLVNAFLVFAVRTKHYLLNPVTNVLKISFAIFDNFKYNFMLIDNNRQP